MRGKRGSKILLTIVREGEAKPLEISVTRDVIRVKSVRSRILRAWIWIYPYFKFPI